MENKVMKRKADGGGERGDINDGKGEDKRR